MDGLVNNMIGEKKRCRSYDWEDFVFGSDVHVTLELNLGGKEPTFRYTPDGVDKEGNILIDFKTQYTIYYGKTHGKRVLVVVGGTEFWL